MGHCLAELPSKQVSRSRPFLAKAHQVFYRVAPDTLASPDPKERGPFSLQLVSHRAVEPLLLLPAARILPRTPGTSQPRRNRPALSQVSQGKSQLRGLLWILQRLSESAEPLEPGGQRTLCFSTPGHQAGFAMGLRH